MPEVNQEQAANPAVDNAKKITLKFRRKHVHVDAEGEHTYQPGESGKFTQAEADMIRKTGAVEMPPALTDEQRKAQQSAAAAQLGLKQ